MDNKTVAKHALGFIGGKPKVDRFYNEDESESVDIMSVDGGEIQGVRTCATIGLNGTDIGLTAKEKTLRVELIASGTAEAGELGCILATAALEIMEQGRCFYGMIFPNVISSYMKDTDMKHAVLMSPAYWPKYYSLEEKDAIVTWLMLVPISEAEKAYIHINGVDAFDRLLGEKDADVLDYSRKSIL
jgi:hypothetical protein